MTEVSHVENRDAWFLQSSNPGRRYYHEGINESLPVLDQGAANFRYSAEKEAIGSVAILIPPDARMRTGILARLVRGAHDHYETFASARMALWWKSPTFRLKKCRGQVVGASKLPAISPSESSRQPADSESASRVVTIFTKWHGPE